MVPVNWSFKESKQNNEGGGICPNCSGEPKVISQKVDSWSSWVFQQKSDPKDTS